MKVSIKQIAHEAQVSTATVSNALNRTRYVSPELAQRVFDAAQRLGYYEQSGISHRDNALRVGKKSRLAFVAQGVLSTFYANLLNELSAECLNAGYILSVYNFQGNAHIEKHIISELLTDRRIAGMFICPSALSGSQYRKLLSAEKPFILIDREIEDVQTDCVRSDYCQGIRAGMLRLIRDGHERIGLLLQDQHMEMNRERIQGYIESFQENNIEIDRNLILNVSLQDGKTSKDSIKAFIRNHMPTAILAAGNTLTLRCLKSIEEMGLNCPKNISVVGFGDNEWCSLISPPLTAITQNTRMLAHRSLELLQERMQNGAQKLPPRRELVPMNFVTRESTLSIARGPFGERVVYPEEVMLTAEDIEQLKHGNYSVAISFHFTGSEWTRLHELAIKETLSNWGVRVMAITDANFDSNLQNTQLEALVMQSPDALIAVPVDEDITAAKFREIAGKTKLILMSNMPSGLSKKDFSYWICVNEKENGQAAANILLEHFQETRRAARVGMLVHGTPFFCTKQRDYFAERTLTENDLDIQVVSKKSFITIENTYATCRQMMLEHPEINSLYVTWDRPALHAIRALKDLGREDVVITTTDLDYEIASYMHRHEMVLGLSTQRPYEQGKAVALATARALLNKEGDVNCIGVPPYLVRRDNLEKAWREILHTEWNEL